MADMLIFMENREGATINHTCKLAQRGDVVHVKPDGQGWGVQERAAPFTLVHVPDATVDDLMSFLSPEQALPGGEDQSWADLNNTRQFRGFKVDVDAYVPGLRAGGTATVPLADVMALKVQKPPVPDPKVLGQSGKIIG
jgi:hypothetical protein